jgi:isopentenyl-diphosphate delta-isomerase
MVRNHPMPKTPQETRKLDHIELALAAQTAHLEVDRRFYYEPLFSAHPASDIDLELTFLDKKLKAPLWVSSMTGGAGPARHINQNLARVCHEFGLGMGLGSCRVLLEDDSYLKDFNLRPILGEDLPLFANLGIAQIEQLLEEKKERKINDLVSKLDADGLIVHINPLQEWFQREGDHFKNSPLETLTKLCEVFKHKIIVKEVGQGMGPKSLQALLELPIAGIELAAFGGTNFTKLEQLRENNIFMESISKVGHTASEMVASLNSLLKNHPDFKQKQIIISGGIGNILDGYFLLENLNFNSVIGQAKNFLVHAENYSELKKFTEAQIKGLKIAKAFLVAKPLACGED